MVAHTALFCLKSQQIHEDTSNALVQWQCIKCSEVTGFVSQGIVQDPPTALILLHLHQKLSQVIAQEALLLSL